MMFLKHGVHKTQLDWTCVYQKQQSIWNNQLRTLSDIMMYEVAIATERTVQLAMLAMVDNKYVSMFA